MLIYFEFLLFFAAVKFGSQGYVRLPCFWVNADVPRYNRFVQYVPYWCESVRISYKNLYKIQIARVSRFVTLFFIKSVINRLGLSNKSLYQKEL